MKQYATIFFLAFTLLSNARENKYYGNEFVFSVPKNVIYDDNIREMEHILSIYSQSSNNIKLLYDDELLLDTTINETQILNIELSNYKNLEDFQVFKPASKSRKVFNIQSINPISANFISSAYNSGDATSLIPVKQSGKEYTLTPFNNSLVDINPENSSNYYSFGMIIGLEDSTNIYIKTDSKLYDGNNEVDEISITLNKNELYYLTAGYTSEEYDLTGTSIKSDKNISVFSGNRAARVLNLVYSRDLLLNQEQPNNTQGNNYIIGRLHSSKVEFLPVFRVISLYDNNTVKLNNQSFVLNKNEWRQIILDSNSFVDSEKPIVIAEYMKSMPRENLGDPALVTLTPVEQYVSNYSYAIPNVKEVIKHYVAVSCLDSIADKITLNGTVLNKSNFEKVGSSEYLYGVFLINTDSVILNSEYDFGAIAFGVGDLNSYTMNLGSNMRDITKELDRFTASITNDNCSNEIFINDSSEFNSGLKLIEIDSDNLTNIELKQGQNTAIIKYNLIDEAKDAKLILSVLDSNLNIIDTTIFIKGFTLEANLQIPEDLEIQRLENWELSLINTGSFTQKLSFRMNEGRLTTLPTGYRNTSLDTNDSELVSLYSYSLGAEQYTDTLFIYNECNKVIKIPISIHFGFGVDVETKCDVNVSVADKYKNNAQISRTELYDISGKLLEAIEGSIDRNSFTNKYSNQAIIIKEYHQNHIHISKIIIAN